MEIAEMYKEVGGDFSDAMVRLGNEERIKKFALMFPRDDSMQNLRKAISDGDIKASFQAVHTLKGVAGNLSFTALYQAASDLTEQLRPLEEPADPALFEKVDEVYTKTIDALNQL